MNNNNIRFLNVILFSFAVFIINAQENADSTYMNLIEMPVFGNCKDSLKDFVAEKKCSDRAIINYISQNIEYPATAKDKLIEGMAVIRFIVEKDGSINNEQILKNPGAGTGEEALRVVSEMSNWTPGYKDGQAVRTLFTLPVRFDLNDVFDAKIRIHDEEFNGKTFKSDKGFFSYLDLKKEEWDKFINMNKKGFPIHIYFEDQKNYFDQYFLSWGKTGKKHLINNISKNKGVKKKIIKEMEFSKNGPLYFYTGDYIKKFLEIRIIE